MNREFAPRRLRELLTPVRDQATEIGDGEPFIIDAIHTLALTDGFDGELDVDRDQILLELVEQAGFEPMQPLAKVFEEEEEEDR